MSWCSRHPYLVESAVLLALAVGLPRLLPRSLRLLGAAGGLLAAPFAALSVVHVPGFWNPDALWRGPLRLEDMLWCAAAGIIAWVFALYPPRHRLRWTANPRRVLFFGAGCAVIAISAHGAVLALWPSPHSVMPATLMAMAVAAIVAAIVHRPSRSFAGCSAVAYAACHWLDVKAFFWCWPHTSDYWTPAAQLPFALADVPLYEVLWALVFGFAWPVMLACVFQVVIDDKGLPKTQARGTGIVPVSNRRDA